MFGKNQLDRFGFASAAPYNFIHALAAWVLVNKTKSVTDVTSRNNAYHFSMFLNTFVFVKIQIKKLKERFEIRFLKVFLLMIVHVVLFNNKHILAYLVGICII